VVLKKIWKPRHGIGIGVEMAAMFCKTGTDAMQTSGPMPNKVASRPKQEEKSPFTFPSQMKKISMDSLSDS